MSTQPTTRPTADTVPPLEGGEVVSPPSARDFAGGLEHLAVGNFVDLNVLVVERTLLEESGGFDPGLPRAVDYDLVYKIAQRADLGYLPFIAAVAAVPARCVASTTMRAPSCAV